MVSSVPNQPTSNYSSSSGSIKPATPEVIIYDDGGTPIELMQDLLFEDIGGQELLTVSRHDILTGQKVSYQPIKNLSDISIRYNSQNIIFLPDSIANYFKNFKISAESKLPTAASISGKINAEVDATTGEMTLGFELLKKDEQIEVQVFSEGNLFDDTIY
jgi:hypothetical protein